MSLLNYARLRTYYCKISTCQMGLFMVDPIGQMLIILVIQMQSSII